MIRYEDVETYDDEGNTVWPSAQDDEAAVLETENDWESDEDATLTGIDILDCDDDYTSLEQF